MAFQWTFPDPLDPSKFLSLIYGTPRNQIFSLGVYFTELQDAVDTLRQILGQASYSWEPTLPSLSGTKRNIKFNHYIQLRTRITILLKDYGYESEVDILGREWADYVILFGKRVGSYQLLQDFRDVLNALSVRLEQWIVTKKFLPFIPNQQIVGSNAGIVFGFPEGAQKDLQVIGDIGTWTFKSLNLQTYATPFKKFGYPGEGGEVFFDVSLTPAEADSTLNVDLLGYYDQTQTIFNTATQGGQTFFTVSMSNESYLPELIIEAGDVPDNFGNFVGDAFNKEIELTANSVFKIDMLLSGLPAQVFSSAFAREIGEGVTDTGIRTADLVMEMRLFFHKNVKPADYVVIDKDLQDPPKSYFTTFRNTSLNIFNKLIVTHNTGSLTPTVKVYNDKGAEVPDLIIEILSVNQLSIDFSNRVPLSGTWNIIIYTGMELGDTYLIPAGSSAEWFGHSDDIAEWTQDGWLFVPPKQYLRVEASDEDVGYGKAIYMFDEGEWTFQELTPGNEITDLAFTDSEDFTEPFWTRFPYSNFNDTIQFLNLNFKTYQSGEFHDYDLINYIYKWTGIRIFHHKAIQVLGSFQESVLSFNQSGNTPSVSLIINKIGIVEII